MANPIVTVQVTQTVAPTPNNLQKFGALISSGGTVLSPGSHALLQEASDLDDYLPADALDLTTVAWSNAFGGQVTATTADPHGQPTGTRFPTTITGVSPNGYNGTVWATATGPSAFTYYLSTDPGVQTVAGQYTSGASSEVRQMVNSFYGMGFQQSVYVLEVGNGDVASQVAVLESTINDSAQMFYSYLVPRAWDGDSAFDALIAQYTNTTSKTYFFVTTKMGTYARYAGKKAVVTMIEAPTYGAWPQLALASATWAAGVVTAATDSNHGVKPGDMFTIIGATPAGYNGTFQAMPGTTGTALVWSSPTDPGGDATEAGTLKASVYASTGTPANEFSLAAAWWVTLNYAPSQTNKVTPYSFAYLYGVTRFPSQGNGALFAQLKAANVNIVGYGGEGGISDTILIYGHTMDGKPFNYWYSVDWMQINIDLDVSAAVINGSNDPINPLYYNQDGINRLEGVSANTGSRGIANGLALGAVKQVALDPVTFVNNINSGAYAGQLVVNAIPFTTYTQANPNDYSIGEYDGLAMAYIPLRGFEHILFNIHVSDFVASAV